MSNFKTIKYYGYSVTLDATVLASKMFKKLENGRWEPRTFRNLRKYLDSATVYVDIGSWVGVLPFWALNIAKSVIAIDPDPVCIESLERLKAENAGSMTIIHAALSDQDSVKINPVKGFGSSETSVVAIGNGASIDVPGIKIPSLMQVVGDNKSFIKVDIEGYEYFIQKELQLIANYNVKAVQIAVHPQIFIKTLSGSYLKRRIALLKATFGFKNLLPGFSLCNNFFDKIKFYLYLSICVFAMRIPKGTDLLYKKI